MSEVTSNPETSVADGVPTCPVGDCNLTVDMILQSSDGESFGAHQFNLECYSAGFPPAASTIANSPEDMTVELTETAVVLRLMLQYMHNVRQPDLSKISFLVLFALAEAVEKYLIFPAMDVCKVFMELSKDDYPSEVLMYAAKHDYLDLADKAARLTIGKSDSEIMSAAERLQAPDIIILKWFRYREQWLTLLRSAMKESGGTQHKGGSIECERWPHFHRKLILKLLEGPESMLRYAQVAEERRWILEGCTYCWTRVTQWERRLDSEVNNILPFSKV